MKRLRLPYLALLEGMRDQLADLHRGIRLVLDHKPAPLPTPAPFVCAVAIGEDEHGALLTCGDSGRMKNDHVSLEMVCQVPMRHVKVIVFADLDQVLVHGIFYGTDFMHAALGSCPVATIREWMPGVKVRVQATKRG